MVILDVFKLFGKIEYPNKPSRIHHGSVMDPWWIRDGQIFSFISQIDQKITQIKVEQFEMQHKWTYNNLKYSSTVADKTCQKYIQRNLWCSCQTNLWLMLSIFSYRTQKQSWLASFMKQKNLSKTTVNYNKFQYYIIFINFLYFQLLYFLLR